MNEGKETSQNDVYLDLRDRLISGRFKPGQKLMPSQLKADYNTSASTIREILFRMSCEGFVDFQEQRGFRCPHSSEQKLLELTHLRILLECEGAAGSIRNGDVEWEAQLNASHHKLAHIESKMKSADDITPFVAVWSRSDWEFHQRLISACGSSLLIETHRGIYDRFRQQVVSELRTFGFRAETIPEHKAILDAALQRDIPTCTKAIEDHLRVYRDHVAGKV
ncbi:MAG: GntR family transcriptional regulator [Rhizobiaceae bacterium]|nr:GntR family transcriptional regulator [Rhizobiaceae bacterium]